MVLNGELGQRRKKFCGEQVQVEKSVAIWFVYSSLEVNYHKHKRRT